MPFYPQNVASQGACPNSLLFCCFHFIFTFESIKELASTSNAITLHVMLLHVFNVIILHATLLQKLDVTMFENFGLLPFKILPF